MGFDYRNMMNVTCSHITFVGKGKTTILGGVFVHGKQNVKFEELSVTNPKKMDKKKQKKPTEFMNSASKSSTVSISGFEWQTCP